MRTSGLSATGCGIGPVAARTLVALELEMKPAIVHVKDATVHSRTHGQTTFRNQVGLLETADGEALRIEISLPREMEQGYAVGSYLIGGASFSKDNYGRPCLGNRGLFLVPVK